MSAAPQCFPAVVETIRPMINDKDEEKESITNGNNTKDVNVRNDDIVVGMEL